MMRLIWVTALAVSVTVGFLALGSPPPADAKTRAECEQLEAALRSAISYEVNYTQQQKDEYVARNSAQCNEEARADEAKMKQTDFSIWTVDCDGGRINRTHWSCSIHIFYHCLRGRIRVSGAGHKNHRPYYRAKGSELRPCRV